MLKKPIGLLLSALLLCSCGNSVSSVDSSIAKTEAVKTAEEICSQLKVDGELSPLKDRNIKGTIFQGEDITTDQAVFLSKEGKSDMIGVFFTDDPEKVEEYIRDYIKDYEDDIRYSQPSEVFKLDKAVIESNGKNQVILIVNEDIEGAKKIAQSILK